MKNKENIGRQNPIEESLKRIRVYFKPYHPKTNPSLNTYHILVFRLRWLNPFHPKNADYSWGMRFYLIYYFFKCYLTPPLKQKDPSMDELAGVWDWTNDK